jgi:membrane protein YqaA with SNARE-associated domain
MLNLLIQRASRRGGRSFTSTLRHLGAAGLFFLAIIDSSPLPTFAGPDILTAILAASHRGLWYEYASVATAGSVLGAYLTFRLARKAESAYLDRKFRKGRVAVFRKLFDTWGSGALFASTAIPFPFPTSMFFVAAGASNYRRDKFLILVAFARGIRYTAIAILADFYGRHFIRVLSHPGHHWGWFVLFALLIVLLIVGGILINRQVSAARREAA